MKYVIIAAIMILMVSCGSTRKAMDSWLGSDKTELIRQWGPPFATVSDGGTGEIMVFTDAIYIPAYSITNYRYRMFYVNKEGKIYHWIVRTENVPPQQIDLNIYRRY